MIVVGTFEIELPGELSDEEIDYRLSILSCEMKSVRWWKKEGASTGDWLAGHISEGRIDGRGRQITPEMWQEVVDRAFEMGGRVGIVNWVVGPKVRIDGLRWRREEGASEQA